MWKDALTVAIGTMPLIVTIVVAAWLNGKQFDTLNGRIDDANRRIDETNRRIDEFRAEVLSELRQIRAILTDLDRRITRLEERSFPVVHG